MKLYTFFKNGEKLVLGTFVEGKTRFFYKGFSSEQEAKAATFKFHVDYNIKQSQPNKQGITRPIGLIKAEVAVALCGEWSEIE